MESDVKTSSIVLGTAQFGSHYGIANSSGQVELQQIKTLLSLAKLNGVDTLDTAVNYGNSEERLGYVGADHFKVVTKVPPLPLGCVDINAWLLEHVTQSLQRLHLQRLHGLLLHNAADLSSHVSQGLVEALVRLRDSGLVERIGVSIYQPSDLESVDSIGQLDIVQAPLNVFDRRIVDSGMFANLQDMGLEVHLRSAFLQGLLLMPLDTIPPYFTRWRSKFLLWHAWYRDIALTPLQACLCHVRQMAPSAKIVVGCDNATHLMQILEAERLLPIKAPDELSSLDLRLVNPSSWPSI